MIAPNPLASILKVPSKPSILRPVEREAQLTHQALEQCVGALQALLGDPPARGGKSIEYHEDEPVSASGQSVRHDLGRLPRGYVVTYSDANVVIYSDRQRWSDTLFYLATAAKSARVSFFLFAALLAALLGPSAQAAECATYGFAEGQPVRFWLCSLATDTTTGAADGDYRYNKDTDLVQSYNGAVWANVGGGGGAPTTATYITQTADAGLSAEQAMGLLGSGLVLNTTTSGVQSIYAGSTCGAGTKATATSAAGALTCSAVALGVDVSGVLPLANITDDAGSGKCLLSGGAGDPAWTACPGGGSTPTGTGFRHVTAGAEDAASVLVTLTSATHVAANQGTTTTLLHGNAAGQASFGNVVSADFGANILAAANGGTGLDTSATGVNRILQVGGAGWTVPAVPDCDDTGGQHLNYNNVAGGGPAWTCGTTGGGSGLSHDQTMTRVVVGF